MVGVSELSWYEWACSEGAKLLSPLSSSPAAKKCFTRNRMAYRRIYSTSISLLEIRF